MTENEQMEMSALWQDFRRKVRRRKVQRIVVYSLISAALFLIPAGIWLGGRHVVTESVVLMAEGIDVVLCDGTHVSLAEGSRLYYPERFDGDVRRVRLEGKAHFDVESSPENPFIIDAAGGYIRVTGTRFTVTESSQNCFKVALEEGRVELGKEGSEPVVLLPSEEVEYDTESGVVVESDLAFMDDTLETVMEEISAIYGFEYVFADDAAKNHRLLFRIPKYDNPSKVIGLIETVCDIRTAFLDGVLTIYANNNN